MTKSEIRRRIDTAFEFLGRVADHPDRFPDQAVLFLMDPGEISAALTKERLRILREFEARTYASLTALAQRLGRDVSRLRKDVMALERLGLVAFSKSGNRLLARPTATGIYIPPFTAKGHRTHPVEARPERSRAAHRHESQTP